MLQVARGHLAEAFAQLGRGSRARVLEPRPPRVGVAESDARGRLDELRDAAGREEQVGRDDRRTCRRWSRGSARRCRRCGATGSRPRASCTWAAPRGRRTCPRREGDLRVLGQPARSGRIGADEDATHPWREQVHRAQRVLQLVDLPAALGLVALADDMVCMQRARSRRNSTSEPSTHENTMSISKSMSLASGAHMCSIVRQSRPCRCTVASTASERGSGAPHQRSREGASITSSPNRQNSGCSANSGRTAGGRPARRAGGRAARPAACGAPTACHPRRARVPHREPSRARSWRRRTARPRTRGRGCAPRCGRRSTAMTGRPPSRRTSRWSMPTRRGCGQEVLGHRLGGVACPFAGAYCPCGRRGRRGRTVRARRAGRRGRVRDVAQQQGGSGRDPAATSPLAQVRSSRKCSGSFVTSWGAPGSSGWWAS